MNESLVNPVPPSPQSPVSQMKFQPLSDSQRYPLQDILLADLCAMNKTVIVLLLAIIATAMSTVWITYQTRILVSEKNQLVLEKQALENEYVNLQLEETTLSNNKRIEAIATKNLGLKQIEPEQEVVILE